MIKNKNENKKGNKMKNKLDNFKTENYYVELTDINNTLTNEVGIFRKRLNEEMKKEEPNKILVNYYLGRIDSTTQNHMTINALYLKNKKEI